MLLWLRAYGKQAALASILLGIGLFAGIRLAPAARTELPWYAVNREMAALLPSPTPSAAAVAEPGNGASAASSGSIAPDAPLEGTGPASVSQASSAPSGGAGLEPSPPVTANQGSASGQAPVPGHTNGTGSLSASPGQGLVDINTAPASRLTDLPGIGPGKAQAIIAYREAKGSFKKPEDLKKVKGIGEKTYDRLKSKISVGP